MPKVKEILTELESLKVAKLRLFLRRSHSLVEARNYYKKIEGIVEDAKKKILRFLESL